MPNPSRASLSYAQSTAILESSMVVACLHTHTLSGPLFTRMFPPDLATVCDAVVEYIFFFSLSPKQKKKKKSAESSFSFQKAKRDPTP